MTLIICLIFSLDSVKAEGEGENEQQKVITPIVVGKSGSFIANGPMVPIKINNTGLLQMTTANSLTKMDITVTLYGSETDEKPLIQGGISKTGVLVFPITKKGTYFLKASSKDGISSDIITINKSKIVPDTNLALIKNKWVTGYYNLTKKRPIYYKITLKADGVIKIKGKSKSSIVLYHTNKTKALSKVRRLNKESQYKTMFALKAGSYYIKVTSDQELVSLTYNFKIINNSSGEKLKEARNIILGSSYIKGMIPETDTVSNVQWYKYKLSKKKLIVVSMLLHAEGTNFRLEIYDNKKKPLPLGSIILKDNEQLILKSPGQWNKGTYYLKITKTNNYGSGYYYLKVK